MPENKVIVHGYQPHPDQREPDGAITITGHFEDDRRDGPKPGEYVPDWQTRLAERFSGDAQAILDILANNLPGGTMHQLLIKMLQREVCLHVVQDVPDTTIKDIAELARAFVWEPEQWETYSDSKSSNSVAWPPEWLLLCEAVERRYGPPPASGDAA